MKYDSAMGEKQICHLRQDGYSKRALCYVKQDRRQALCELTKYSICKSHSQANGVISAKPS